eukprot:GEMP01060621.1.p1 GENE.GEMP01060621.1~~GEMP01060621.1.p1  ORF type:complete len:228 (+),score=36.20 GEMP01060621.1:259-942(+)
MAIAPCTTCIKCDDGYRLVSSECVANACTCVNGDSATTETSPKCTTHETAICSSCFAEYRLADHQCLSETECTKDVQCPKMSPEWLRCHASQKVCVACTSDEDCAHRNDSKRAHCDIPVGNCVMCTVDEQCVAIFREEQDDKKICHPSLKACVRCVDEGDCASRTAICVATNNTCVEPVIPIGDAEAIAKKVKTWQSKGGKMTAVNMALFLPVGLSLLASYLCLTRC